MRYTRWTDPDGRTWKVYAYAIIAGEVVPQALENGQYRLFVPDNGGARRSVLVYDRDRAKGIGDAVLAEQFARTSLYLKDDPVFCAKVGLTPERVDP